METLEAWLALARAPGIHADLLRDRPEWLLSPELLIGQSPVELKRLGFNALAASRVSQPDWAKLRQDLDWLQREQIHLIAYGSADYPPLLQQAPDAPLVLFARGAGERLQDPQLAMVGSRHPSVNGKRIAFEFASRLAHAGLTITSGLALGIDTACHEGALTAGRTIAVVGTGLDLSYPPENAKLAARIVAGGGAIVSEYPRGTAPLRLNFPQRNRLISGLCKGILVIEAARRSGSLITARLAGIQGRDVMAVPGSIHNPVSHGCHRLIRQGAVLVESPEDILEELKFSNINQQLNMSLEGPVSPSAEPSPLDKNDEILLDALGFEPTGVDELVARTGQNSQSLASKLLVLELAGKVAMHSGGRYMRVS